MFKKNCRNSSLKPHLGYRHPKGVQFCMRTTAFPLGGYEMYAAGIQSVINLLGWAGIRVSIGNLRIKSGFWKATKLNFSIYWLFLMYAFHLSKSFDSPKCRRKQVSKMYFSIKYAVSFSCKSKQQFSGEMSI